MQVIDGKSLSKKVREGLKKDVEELKEKGIIPKLAVILVGSDSASQIYVRSKSKACQELGIEYEEIFLGEDTQMDELLGIIDSLNKRQDITRNTFAKPST